MALIPIFIFLLQVTFNHAQEPEHYVYPVYNKTSQIPLWQRLWGNYIWTDSGGLITTDNRFLPWDEYNHFPNQAYNEQLHVPTPGARYVNGTESENRLPSDYDTPDYRIPQPPMTGQHSADSRYYHEDNRYYRIHVQQWIEDMESAMPEFGIKKFFPCYGSLVFKRLNLLAMTAQLTAKHVLTTALATDMVVKRYKNKKTLNNILGWWYHNEYWEPWGWIPRWMYVNTKAIHQRNNESFYATPARIHYHPRWNRPELLNRSFPIPCVYDLAVLTATFHCVDDTCICQRSTPGLFQGANRPPLLLWGDFPAIIGTQMVMDINRKPFPWFRYMFKADHIHFSSRRYPCPKTEWGWFICLEFVGPAGKFGLDSGAMLHSGTPRSNFWSKFTLGMGGRYKGLMGVNSFSMRLRSKNFVNYFTIVDTHPVLDFIYAAYMGRIPYAYLDDRFYNTQWRSPRQKTTKGYQKMRIWYWRGTTPKMWTSGWFGSYHYYPGRW